MLDIRCPRMVNNYDTPYRGSVFTSASGEGAQAWSSPTSSQHVDPEEELITYDKSPISLEDDPEPQVLHRSFDGHYLKLRFMLCLNYRVL